MAARQLVRRGYQKIAVQQAAPKPRRASSPTPIVAQENTVENDAPRSAPRTALPYVPAVAKEDGEPSGEYTGDTPETWGDFTGDVSVHATSPLDSVELTLLLWVWVQPSQLVSPQV